MNFRKNYYDYVNYVKSLHRENDGKYYEKHHIKMRSLFPELTYDPENIILLTSREHHIAHYLLWKGWPCKETAYAFWMISNMTGKINSRAYERAREKVRKTISKVREGSKWATNGKEVITVYKGDILPDGFQYGMVFRSKLYLKEKEKHQKSLKEKQLIAIERKKEKLLREKEYQIKKKKRDELLKLQEEKEEKEREIARINYEKHKVTVTAGGITLHPNNEEELLQLLEVYKLYSPNIRNLNATFKCQACGKSTERNMLQLKRRPKLLCRPCYMVWKYGVANVSQREDVKQKKRKTK